MSGFTQQYQTLGVREYYTSVKDCYSNPHKAIVQELVNKHCSQFESVLDLACGSGEVTLALPQSCKVEGIDPFTSSLYVRNTGRQCTIKTFEDLALEGLQSSWDAVVCSFALHIMDRSRLPALLWQLRLCSSNLVIISPTKQPYLDVGFWELQHQSVTDRVHYRHYTSR